MIWYSHLFQNFPQFIVIHRVKGFGTVNKAEVDITSMWNLKKKSVIQGPYLQNRLTDLENELMVTREEG